MLAGLLDDARRGVIFREDLWCSMEILKLAKVSLI